MTRASDLARLMGAGGTLNAALSVDTISEKTSGSGVTIDSLNVKDGGIGGNQIGGRRNIIINGAMQVFQRTSSATAAGTSYNTSDRFRANTGTDGAFTTEQSTDNPFGTGNSLKCQVTTADTSLSATQYAQIIQRIEAQDLQQLSYGTSSAKTLTLSFWVKSNKTGIYSIVLRKPDNTAYHFTHEYTISSANTWEQKEIIITPTAGSTSFITASAGAIDNDNGLGLELSFGLGQGSTYAIGTSNTWSSNTNTYASSNQVNWMDSTSNNFYLTQVQLEVGSQATPFEHRSFGEELGLCQRYFQYLPAGSVGRWISSTTAEVCCNFPTLMRAVPTISINPNDNTCLIYRLGLSTNASTVSGISSTYISESGGMVPLTVSSTASTPSTGDFAHYDTDGASEVVFCDSEL